MIVAKGQSEIGQIIIVGLTEADVAEMRKGLTKTKQGNELYGFSSLVVFMGATDNEMIGSLNKAGSCVRRDDLFPNAGQG
jgi:hypothetical protein